MADTKITALTALTAADPANDVLPIVDVSDTTMAASGTTKKISVNNILGASGTATLASATITGDLTVDTSTLKVDSANNRVGIGTASPYSTAESLNARTTALTSIAAFQSIPLTVTDSTAYALGVGGGINFRAKLDPTNYSNYAAIWSYRESAINSDYRGSLIIGTSDNSNGYPIERYRIASDGVATWSNVGGVAGTAMTLNSTGLGVGGAPLSGFRLNVNNGDFRVSDNQNEDGVELGWSAGGSNGFVQAYNRTTSAFKDLVLNNAATITASGNVGIGVTPSTRLHIQNTGDVYARIATTSVSKAGVQLSANGVVRSHLLYDDGAGTTYLTTGTAFGGSGQALAIQSGTSLSIYTNNQLATAQMTLDASGNLLVGTTTTSGNAGGLKLSNVGGTLGQITFSNNSGVADYVTRFNYGSTPTLVGTITVASGGTTYNTTSDYRLKESVQPLVGGLARVSALKPSIYKWKSDGSSGEGFLAHELAEVVPFAVTGEKDAVNEDGSVKAQGVDLSRVVPILVAAIQELAAEVNALKNA